MLKTEAKPKRLKCKGYDLGGGSSDNNIGNDVVCGKKLSLSSKLLLDTGVARIGKALCNGIPVLSIFALVGISVYILNATSFSVIDMVGLEGFGFDSSNKAYAAESSSGSNTSATYASASLIVDNNTTYDKINASYGNTNYVSHRVTIGADNIDGYTLTITGPSTITTKDSNGNAIADATILSGADNKVPASMKNNTWGYAWDTENAVEDSTSYQSFTGSAQNLETNTNIINNSVNLTKKLTFAAKFADDAKNGHYKATVGLGLTVTPRTLSSLEQISLMQEMTPEICSAAKIGDKATLKDVRDFKTYTVQKLNDGNCWMTQNLALDLSKAEMATVEWSDNLSANYPEEALEDKWATEEGPAWINDNVEQEFSKAPQKISTSSPSDGKEYRDEFGYYYSWCAATAGNCSSTTTQYAEVSGSICPKGWKLPSANSNASTNDFAIMAGLAANVTGNQWSNITNKSFSGNTLTVDDSTWLAAGLVHSSGLIYGGVGGYYWSRTASSDTRAYNLLLNSSNFNPTDNLNRHGGFTIRCISYSS